MKAHLSPILCGLLLLTNTPCGVEEQICRSGFAREHRLPFAEYVVVRDQAFLRAGIPVSMQCHHNDKRANCYILDHICPLELGCGNGLDNLQVQPRAESEAKDLVENEARRRYCSGEITLQDARNWFTRTRP